MKIIRSAAVFLTVMLIALGAASTASADIPSKQGPVVDEADIFTDEETTRLEQAIGQAPFQLYVLTVPSLEGTPIEDYGIDVFHSWNLRGDDVLLIIAVEEREVQIYFDANSPVETALLQHFSGNDPYAAFLNVHFIPFAAEGRFADGVESVIRELSELKNRLTSPAPRPQAPASPGTNGKTSDTGANEDDSAAGKEEHSPKGTNNVEVPAFVKVLFRIVLLGLILCAILIWPLKMLNRHRKWRKELAAARDRHQSILVRLHSLEQELNPLLSLSKGQSRQYLEKWKEPFYQLLQDAASASEPLRNIKVPFFVRSETQDTIMKWSRQIADFVEQADNIEAAVKEYRETETKTRTKAEQIQTMLRETRKTIEQVQGDYRFSLTALLSSCTSLEQRLQEAIEPLDWDPMTARDRMGGLSQLAEQLVRDAATARSDAQVLTGMPEQLASARQRIDRVVQEEQLLLVEIQPYAVFDRAPSIMNQWAHALDDGRVADASACREQLTGELENALNMVQSTVEAKRSNGPLADEVEKRVSAFDDRTLSLLQDRLTLLQQQYVEDEWFGLPEQLSRIRRMRTEIRERMPEIRGWSDPGVQKYLEANRILLDWRERLDQLETDAERLRTLPETLDADFRQALRSLEETRRLYRKCEKRLGELPPLGWLLELSAEAETALQAAERVASLSKRAVRVLVGAVKRATERIHELDRESNAILQAKRQAENTIAKAERSFASALRSYGAYISRRYYDAEYAAVMARAREAMAMAQYDEVGGVLASVQQLVDQMRREYNRNRRDEMERRNNSGSGGWFGGGGSGGGRPSGGGSAWGGGPRGGGSSWGGGARGGGSSWGGGPRGGGSSWGGGSPRGGKSKW